MFKNNIKKLINKLSIKNGDKTAIYVVQVKFYFLIFLVVLSMASYLAFIPSESAMTPTKVAITFAFILASIQVFIRTLDVVFESARNECDDRRDK